MGFGLDDHTLVMLEAYEAAEEAWERAERRTKLRRDILVTVFWGASAVLLALAIDWLFNG